MRNFILIPLVVLLLSCSSETNNPLSSTDNEHSVLLEKKVKTSFTVYLVQGDYFTPNNALLESTCPGTSISTNYAINWEKGSTCIEITPDGASVTLSDDPAIYVKKKRGQIVSVGLAIQDVDGPAGILYTASKITVDPPVTPLETGFTIPVRTDGIEVWRHKGHIGGPPVELVGYISIGDIVYTQMP